MPLTDVLASQPRRDLPAPGVSRWLRRGPLPDFSPAAETSHSTTRRFSPFLSLLFFSPFPHLSFLHPSSSLPRARRHGQGVAECRRCMARESGPLRLRHCRRRGARGEGREVKAGEARRGDSQRCVYYRIQKRLRPQSPRSSFVLGDGPRPPFSRELARRLLRGRREDTIHLAMHST